MITTFNAEYVTIDEMRRNFFDTQIIEGNKFKLRQDLFIKIFELLHNREDGSRLIFEPDDSGQRTFDAIFDEISGFRRISLDNDLNAEYSKMPGTILRLAAVLHSIESVYIFF